MLNKNSALVKRLTIALLLDSLGSAVTWAGLPLLAYRISNNHNDIMGIFLMSSLTSILFGFLGGYLSDRLPPRFLAIGAAVISGIAMALLGWYMSPENMALFYIATFITYAMISLGRNAVMTWLYSLIESDRLEEFQGQLVQLLQSCKLIGLFGGPLLFGVLGTHALFVDAASFMVAAIIFAACPYERAHIRGQEQKLDEINIGQFFAILYKGGSIKFLLLALVPTGALTYPIVSFNISALAVKFQAPDVVISIYWAIAFAGSIFGGALLAKNIHKKYPSGYLYVMASAVQATAFLVMVFLPSKTIYIVCNFFFTAASPLMAVLISANIYRLIPAQAKGKIIGLSDAITDVGAMVGIAMMVASSSSEVPLWLLLYGLPMIFLRAMFVWKSKVLAV